ncbi:MAG: CrcB family protein [Acidobacteriota bacterium]
MQLLLWVAFGGVAGAAARTLLETLALRVFIESRRSGVVLANLFGAAALGTLMHVGLNLQSLPQGVRIGFAAGLLGGFTTAAAFNNDTVQLFRKRFWPAAVGRVLFDTISCLLAGMAGLTGAHWLLGS